MGMDMDMAWAWTWDMDMAWAWAWYGVGLGGAAVPRERHDALPGRAAAARDQVVIKWMFFSATPLSAEEVYMHL